MESLNKKIDKSEKERSTLTRKIIELEEKEDDFNYYRSAMKTEFFI